MRRKDYGYNRMQDSDKLMAIFLASGKKQIEFWGQYVKHSKVPMSSDTFKTRVREYRTRTNQLLSSTQIERVRVSPEEFMRLAQLYLQVSAALLPAGQRMNKAQFYDVHVIVPPYNKVPSFEQFKVQLILILLDIDRRDAGSASNEACDNAALQHGSAIQPITLCYSPYFI